MADKKSNRVWRVGRDEAGNAVLEWNPHTLRAERVEIYEGSDCDDLDLTGDLLRRRCRLLLCRRTTGNNYCNCYEQPFSFHNLTLLEVL